MISTISRLIPPPLTPPDKGEGELPRAKSSWVSSCGMQNLRVSLPLVGRGGGIAAADGAFSCA
jgi:hypothetical protein